MKTTAVFSITLGLALLLTACGSANRFGTSPSGSRALSPEAKLALGTIKLEGSPQAVDAKTSAKLIPLWQLMLQLNTSSSSAPQEVTAVMEQIKATMTPQQLDTINGMSLTQADIFTVFQTQASGSSGANGSGGGGFGGGGFGGGNRGGGFLFAGGGPGGGPGGGFGGGGFGGGGFRANNGAGSASATPVDPAQAAQARQNAISSLLVNQLIKLLQTKTHG